MLDSKRILLSMKTQKDEMIFARADRELVRRLQRVAQRNDIPASQIVRAGVKAELDRIEGKVRTKGLMK